MLWEVRHRGMVRAAAAAAGQVARDQRADGQAAPPGRAGAQHAQAPRVESGAISGSKADAWKKATKDAMAEEVEVAAIRVKAEGGDAVAMRKLGSSYRDGKRGLKKDVTQGFMWFKRAADLKEVRALTACGTAYLNGEGVEQSDSRGLSMLSVAAAMGSEHACAILGLANAEGRFGFDKDPQEATRWYREMQNCACPDSSEEYREDAAAWLREHP